jgi:cell division protein FtsI/penicillin-binding protein 2
VLSLDSVVQLYAERELDALMGEWAPRGAAASVMDPLTGEILAMASRPTFDPNDPVDAPPAAWRNNAIAAAYEPGSTFKPLVVASALERGLLRRDEELDCEGGAYQMGRRLLHDHHPYGVLSVTDILVKSSNIGMAKVGERLGTAGLFEAVHRWGFGRRTGVRLPGEVVGIVRPLSRWDGYSTGSVPMGQEIAVTPLQLVAAHAALASGGRLVKPRLVLRDIDAVLSTTDAGPPQVRPPVSSRVVSEDVARWIVTEPMRQVVERGTGRQARIDGYSVFGKTGTAQKPDPETGRVSSEHHVAAFVCGAPADEPRAVVLVLVDEPSVGTNHGGGTVAAPAASRILHRTLIHLRVPAE